MDALADYGLVPVREVAPTLARAARGVPVRVRAGVYAYAVVDAEDYERCLAHRWRLDRGYVVCTVQLGDRKRSLLLHRLLVGLEHGDPREVDHEDGDRLHNRRSNLRVCTHAQNLQNRHRAYGSSRYRGVSWDRGVEKWRAQGRLNGRPHYIGVFESEQEAADAAAAWREVHMPFTTN